MAWGAFLVYVSVSQLYHIIYLHNQFQSLQIKNYSVLNLFKSYHLFFLVSLFTFTGGAFLFMNWRSGWIMSMAGLLLNSFIYLIPNYRSHNTGEVKDQQRMAMLVLMAVIFLVFFFILRSRDFREKYAVTKKTWVLIFVIVLLFLADKVFLYLIS